MLPLALALFAVADASSAVPALVLCGKIGTWNFSSIATAPSTIAMMANATQCLTVQTAPLSDGKTCAAAPDGKGCLTLGPCTAASKWQLSPSKTAGQSFITTEKGAFCLDFLSDKKGRDIAAVRRRSTRAAPRGPLHEGRSTGRGLQIFFVLMCAQY